MRCKEYGKGGEIKAGRNMMISFPFKKRIRSSTDIVELLQEADSLVRMLYAARDIEEQYRTTEKLLYVYQRIYCIKKVEG
ncbi:hypothetical protein HMPREF0083_03467 [Aneurinibacillus aneurinilyticus ATCC 12856]|uniref:Uncharacterized protein n=3 Tax=Aneurinibacillus aneurinilyticus TaxID=1391 RepID=U1X0D6_ANEAE|nr:hypothetical protein HMPREF0083_03467 [Aneurinibacillus aneurinilyticus ATCC 12856]